MTRRSSLPPSAGLTLLLLAPLMGGGCAFFRGYSDNGCVNVDAAALPEGVFIGQPFADARVLLGKPLREIDGDFSLAGGSIVTLFYPTFTISESITPARPEEVIGSFSWTKPGTGPIQDLRIGEPPRTRVGHTMKYHGEFGYSGEFPTVPVCRMPHSPKLRITYFVKDGVISSIHLQTWEYPF